MAIFTAILLNVMAIQVIVFDVLELSYPRISNMRPQWLLDNSYHFSCLRLCSMFGAVYGDAHMPNWPHRHGNSCLESPHQACVGTRGGTLWGRQPFCPHFFFATGVCGWCDYTLPLFKILGLAGILAASKCLRVRPAWIVFLFCCWVANWVGGGWRGPALGLWLCYWVLWYESNLSGKLSWMNVANIF